MSSIIHYRRVDKPPSKEHIRLFIRAYSVRSGQNPNSPWIVDEDKVKEFHLPSKINDFFLSPVKVIFVLIAGFLDFHSSVTNALLTLLNFQTVYIYLTFIVDK